MLGDKIKESISLLDRDGIKFQNRSIGERTESVYGSERYDLKIYIDPKTILQLNFSLKDSTGRTRLSYDIDTDLYDLRSPDNQRFAHDIEDAIAHFLSSLREQKIMVEDKQGRMAMIFPEGQGYRLITRGRFFTKSQTVKNKEKVLAGGSFKPLELREQGFQSRT